MLSVRKVTAINLAHNKVYSLPERLLEETLELEEFDMSANKMHKIGAKTFAGLKKLKTLLIADNYIGKFFIEKKVKQKSSLFLNSTKLQSNFYR